MRNKIVAGNWKMNNDLENAEALISETIKLFKPNPDDRVLMIMCVPFPYLMVASELTKNTAIKICAQNCSEHTVGAYTGEVSAKMLRSIDIPYVIVGHSERRKYFAENSTVLSKKVDQALTNGIIPIFCCGEPVEVRASNSHQDYVINQIREGLFHLSSELIKRTVIAYEPVWAIGTGQTATATQAQDMHALIRKKLSHHYDVDTADSTTILYGGSLSPSNSKELFSCPDVDGGLIGGASLNAKNFVEIAYSF